MTFEELEKCLERGEQWGFRKETDSPDYLGWILITKRKPPFVWKKEAYDNEELYFKVKGESERLAKAPYHVRVIELRRDVHESDAYEENDDYRLNDNRYFASLAEVEEFIKTFGYDFDSIKWRGELDAP
jgi:hypothetical protein